MIRGQCMKHDTNLLKALISPRWFGDAWGTDIHKNILSPMLILKRNTVNGMVHFLMKADNPGVYRPHILNQHIKPSLQLSNIPIL